jgi:hypothetical protein
MSDMNGGFAAIVAAEAAETARRKAMGERGDSDDVPLSDRLWTLKHIAQYFCKADRSASAITQIESFPKAIKYTLPNGSQSQPLYVPAEVKHWAVVHCRC